MKRFFAHGLFRSLTIMLFASLLRVTTEAQQITVVNMIPTAQSNETNRDAEPNITVNPANPLQIAASAFTPDPGGTNNVVLFISNDGGQHWTITPPILPGDVACVAHVCDISLRYAGSSNLLYVGYLTGDATGLPVNITLRATRITDIFGIPTTDLLESRTGVRTVSSSTFSDQPFMRSTTVLGGSGTGSDRVYFGVNDLAVGVAPQTATVDSTLNAVPPSPAGFNSNRLEVRTTSVQDRPPIRAAVHAAGTVYAAFYGNHSGSTDLVVVRDDNWATGPNPFTSLVDSGDHVAGQRVVTGISFPSGDSLGTQRVGSALAIAVDPNDSRKVFVAWAQGSSPATQSLHLRHSADGGQTWDTTDLRNIGTATNPGLAINSLGKVGFLYQRLVNSGGSNRWETHLELSNDGFTTAPTDLTLANVPDQNGSYGSDNPLGDYDDLIAVGKDFYGIFSANNSPVSTNFPHNVTYRRHADFSSNQLFADAAHTMSVGVSIDPFFFHVADTAPALDFYVRDWTTDSMHNDPGLEPSTNPVFYITSDVWNRLSNVAGGFTNDQPNHQNPQEATAGPNFAFVRIHRAAADSLSAAAPISAHFMYADFGVGGNYSDAAMATPSPIVTFTGTQTEQTLADGQGLQWTLPASHSTHVCMAVEISKLPEDPFAQPSLLNHAPGWPTTDISVLNDNNKAQRNIIYGSGTDGSDIGYYALVHNAATERRDMILQAVAPNDVGRKLDRVTVEAGDQKLPYKSGETIRIANMEPGESRMIRVSFTIPKGVRGEPVPLSFNEMVNGQPINGFTIAAQPASLGKVWLDNLTFQRAVFGRVTSSLNVASAEDVVHLTQQALQDASAGCICISAEAEPMAKSIKQTVKALVRSQSGNVALSPEPFLESFLDAVRSGDAYRIAEAQTNLLQTLDAYLTLRQLAEGNPADVLQNVTWQRDLYQKIGRLRSLASAAMLVQQSNEFITSHQSHPISSSDYSDFISQNMKSLQETADALDNTVPGLKKDLAAMQQNSNSLIALQKAHWNFLLKLSKL